METISSRQNSSVKAYARLLSSAKERRSSGLFVCEGARLCNDAVKSGITIEACFVTENALSKYKSYCDDVIEAAGQSYVIAEHIEGVLSDTKSPQGVYCICKAPSNKLDLNTVTSGRYIALENLQDPSNLGTVLRTAEAVGLDGVVLSGCCDMYSPKVIRGSMGAVFRVKTATVTAMTEALNLLNNNGLSTYAAVVSDAVPVTQIKSFDKSVVVIGNEGNGLTEATANSCTARITIPMLGKAESLNASGAAAILMWEMMRGGLTDG